MSKMVEGLLGTPVSQVALASLLSTLASWVARNPWPTDAEAKRRKKCQAPHMLKGPPGGDQSWRVPSRLGS